jgi:glycerol-3-phosphate dehydrogenase subunit B
LLDLATLPQGARIVVPRVPRPEWDADSLARAWSADAFAESRGLRFAAVDAKLLKLAGEDRIAAAELAARHDEPERRAWLRERLRELLAAERADAVLVGPWLGAQRAHSLDLGVPIGEVLAGVGSPAGMRYEHARDALLAQIGVLLEPRRVSSVSRIDGELRVALEGDGDGLATDAVVLAIGGLVAGGIGYHPAEQDAGRGIAHSARTPFRASVDAAVKLAAQGRTLDVGGSMHGPALDALAWPTDADPGLLEAVGILCDGTLAAPDVFAAGDAVADRPRTLLQAAYSGIRAGANAAGDPGSSRRLATS